jgi:ABC-type transport system involved in cytochrome c biogenesis permease subunit
MNGVSRYVPWFVVAAAALYFLMVMMPPADRAGEIAYEEFAKIPVVDGGRIKPIDTLARNTLMVISSRQTFGEKGEPGRPAIQWLLDVMTSEPRLFKEGRAENYKVFRIENDQVLKFLDLKPRPEFYRYSLAEMAPQFERFEKETLRARRVQQQDPNNLDLFDQKILELRHHIESYIELSRLMAPLDVPPQSKGQEWESLLGALEQIRAGGPENPEAFSLAKMLFAYSKSQTEQSEDARRQAVEDFNQELAAYRQRLDQQMPDVAHLASFEVFFNNFAPFYHCSLLYVIVFLLACVSWVVFPKPLNNAAFWLAVVTLVVHTWALGARMYIQGRPPVTNLYSSAVFVGWGCLVLALILEVIFKNGIGTVLAAVTGSLTMLIAHHLAGSGDTLEMMQAVLDTNFWLATHVVCVNLGYATTMVAGFLGILFVVLGVLTTRLNRDMLKTLGQMIYGIVCFGMLLSFTGTVLGGIWADQSWGRFWGWDPKENGALLVVIWNALILHARWGGLIKQPGMAVLAIAGNMIVGWSWFGTNQLGVGLHAYGFNNTLAAGLTIFWITQIALIGLGLLPLKWWRSFATAKAFEEPKSGFGKGSGREVPVVGAAR